MHKNKYSKVPTNKFVAKFPPLIAPSDEEIDQMEIKWLHQQLLDNTEYDDHEEWRFYGWMMELDDAEYGGRCFDHYDLRRGLFRRPVTAEDRLHFEIAVYERLGFFMHELDPDFGNMRNVGNDWGDDPVDLSQDRDDQYPHEDFVRDCGPIVDEHDPDKELMQVLPLKGLKYLEKQAVLQAYC